MAGTLATGLAPNLPSANEHRWRAWALNEDGTQGDFSGSWTFDIEVVFVKPASAR